MSNKQSLMNTITKLSFAMDDTRLFLDTHPDCSKALDYFERIQKLRTKAVDEYTKNYGPINSYDVENTPIWMWNMSPGPWEGRC